MNITFWSNGFSVDNGPLRDFNDPENAEFVDSIKRGLVNILWFNILSSLILG